VLKNLDALSGKVGVLLIERSQYLESWSYRVFWSGWLHSQTQISIRSESF